ncbi:hypothetical protein [Streptomyces bambusae]|uniref:SMI1/KNR4 family protein n=1 Tax=Streptomyces bambusae TaxID=1550616 RepID=A0ABS6Z4V0_9ACTN|nr:hypothetical protein [Streptomyces bambusae]MBW5482747.1 hypothetical protein [Streptomyces bambusae]
MSAPTPTSAPAVAAPDFPSGWCATDLGPYRPCEFTYEVYPPESLPPVDPARLDGRFGWRGGPGEHPSEHTGHLVSLEAELAALGLRLPEDFRTCYGSDRLAGMCDEVSVTACWTDLSGALESPVEDGARLVRFLRDQQDCVIWYLYLRPSGESFVVCSHLDLEWGYRELAQEDIAGFRAAAAQSLVRCATSFEEFAFRFVVENELWMHLNETGGKAALAPHLREYLDHYSAGVS